MMVVNTRGGFQDERNLAYHIRWMGLRSFPIHGVNSPHT